MTTFYGCRSSIEAGEDPALLSTWNPTTEADVRADIARKYAQRSDGSIVESEIAAIRSGRTVYGKRFQWASAVPSARPLAITPYYRCPVCEHRTPVKSETCPRCNEGTMEAL